MLFTYLKAFAMDLRHTYTCIDLGIFELKEQELPWSNKGIGALHVRFYL